MTISESIITWLKRFDAEGLEKIRSVETDLLKASVSYALIKTPQEYVKKSISGTEYHTDYYQFRARLESQTNTERTDNQTWFEGLTSWIKERDKVKDYPVLDGMTCKGIVVKSPFYMGESGNDNAVYQMTIGIEYIKEAKI